MPIRTMMGSKPLILIGGGGHAKVVHDAAVVARRGVAGVYDDGAHPGVCADGRVAHLGAIPDRCDDPDNEYLVAIGDLGRRERCIRVILGACVAGALVHPGSVVSASALIGRGAFVGAGSVVQADARIGAHAIVNTSAVVEHDCRVGINTHLAPGAVLGGGVVVGSGVLVGIGAVVLPGVVIGDGCVVGAGAVVRRDVGDGACVVGNPARAIGVGTRF